MDTVEVQTEDAAVEWGRKPALEDKGNPALEKDKNSTRESGGIRVSLEGKEQEMLYFSKVEMKRKPLFVRVWDRSHRIEKLRGLAIVSIIGVGLLECGGSPPCVGDVLNFFSAVFFGIHMLRTEQISRSTDKKKFMSLLSFEVLVVAFTSILWFLFKDGFVEVQDSSFESWTFGMLWDSAASFPWIPALYTGVLSTGLCMWAEMVAMAHVSATETAIVYGLEPVWGAAFAWFLLGERWDNAAWIGAALVLCGSLTVQLFGSAPEKSKKVEPRSRNALETTLKQQDRFSLSAIPVDSRKNIGSQLERKDKTL